MTTPTQHLLHFEGGNALPEFRASSLLARLSQSVPRITAVHARHVHWVSSAAPLERVARRALGVRVHVRAPGACVQARRKKRSERTATADGTPRLP